MLNLREVSDVNPLCPHCGEILQAIYYQELRGAFGRRYIYFCSKCHKVLGVSHRKGFWMG